MPTKVMIFPPRGRARFVPKDDIRILAKRLRTNYKTVVGDLGKGRLWHHFSVEIAPRNQFHNEARLRERPEDEPPPVNHGFVYLIRPDNMPCKIGLAERLDRRVGQIAFALPWEVRVLHSIRTQDMWRAEEFFHQHFAAKRLRGEWFDLTAEDIEWFKSFETWPKLPSERGGAE